MKLKKNVFQKALKAKDYYEIIGWVGAGFVVWGYYLNANQYLSSWVVWVIGNLCIAGYSAYKKAWPTFVMSIIITIMNIYGLTQWSERI